MRIDAIVMGSYVYMMGSRSGKALYIGVTNNLQRRIYEHKGDMIPGFTRHYQCHLLLYYEHYDNILTAIAREKQLKGWTRQRKEALIKTLNPNREDLAAEPSSFSAVAD